MRKVSVVIPVMLSLIVVAFAGNAGRQSKQGADDSIYFSGEIIGPQVIVTGAPYTAAAVIENTQVLADGNRIIHTGTQLVARDSQGRIRREQTINVIGPVEVKGPRIIFIIDPIAKREYVLNTQTRIATVKKRTEFIYLPSQDNKTAGEREKRSENEAKGSEGNRREQLRQKMTIDISSESLGTRVMEGLNVEGKLNKWTIPPNRIGNEQPINVSVETWSSPDLHIEIMRHRIDPRFGDVRYRLTNIQRTEPPRSLFKIPAGYKIVSNK